MLPLSLLRAAMGHPMVRPRTADSLPAAARAVVPLCALPPVPDRARLPRPQLVELKSGETYNGNLEKCDNWMNLNLREVICTSRVRGRRSSAARIFECQVCA